MGTGLVRGQFDRSRLVFLRSLTNTERTDNSIEVNSSDEVAA